MLLKFAFIIIDKPCKNWHKFLMTFHKNIWVMDHFSITIPGREFSWVILEVDLGNAFYILKVEDIPHEERIPTP